MTVVLGRDLCGDIATAASREWLVTNGIGGYASGTVAGLLTRRYHGILMAALAPPLGRTLLVAKLDETAVYGHVEYPLCTNQWADGSVEPHGYRHIEQFVLDGAIPTWRFACADAIIEKRVWMEHGANTTYVRYDVARASGPLDLTIKVLVNARQDHGTTRGSDWSMDVTSEPHGVRVIPFNGATPIMLAARGTFVEPAHAWHVGFDLSAERERGLDSRDDHLHAATVRATFGPGQSVTVVTSAEPRPPSNGRSVLSARRAYERRVLDCRRTAAPRGTEPVPRWIEQLTLAAEQFIVRRTTRDDPEGRTVIAGYPWFGDWGRDTMIALPGLTLATGRPEVARGILTTFARYADRGLLPNRFDDTGGAVEYNTVDAALWYIEAIRAYHAATRDDTTLRALFPVVEDIISWYARGTRYRIGADPEDGLLVAGEPGVQLTWMDAKVGDRVITPRMGKPVEINALWYNALRAAASFARRVRRDPATYDKMAERTKTGFVRFWNSARGCCYDVLDGPEGHDASVRPNQLFAVSLPESPLTADQQRAVVDVCARTLLTSHGLRSLAPDDPRYVGRYQGDVNSRDAAYHQGTVWGWLLGPFALAHLRVYGDPAAAGAFLEPMAQHLAAAGVGSLSEIFDGDPPFAPRGCIAQAWTVAEVLRAWTEISAFQRTKLGRGTVAAGRRRSSPAVR
ncbi:MAG: amylo-alpha-1,6-glucosidase [Nitrospirota bacterium]